MPSMRGIRPPRIAAADGAVTVTAGQLERDGTVGPRKKEASPSLREVVLVGAREPWNCTTTRCTSGCIC